MNTVRFSQVEDFLKELDADRDLIDRDVIRVTNRLTPVRSNPFARSVDVVASVIMRPRGLEAGRQTWLVKLEQHVGQVWQDGAPSDSRKTEEAAEKIQKQIREWATKGSRQIDVRAGTYVE